MFRFLDFQGEHVSGTDSLSSTYVVDQFPTRTYRFPDASGEPTPEGVHQDGTELAMVSLF